MNGTETNNQELGTETSGVDETANQENHEQDNQNEQTFTQEQVNAIVLKRLNQERAKFADYDDLKKASADYQKSLTEEKQRADNLQKQLDDINRATTLKTMRETVSKDTSVPVDLLTGEDEETCRKQADALLKWAKPNYPGTQTNNTRNNATLTDASMRELARQIFKGE